MSGVSPVDATLDAASPRIGRHRTRHHQLHPFTRRVVARADRCLRYSPVRYITVRNGSRGVDEHRTAARCRKGGRLAKPDTAGRRTGRIEAITAVRRGDLRRESCRSCGHRVQWPDESARRFTLGARRGTRRAPGASKVGVGEGSGSSGMAAPRVWWVAIAFRNSRRPRHHASMRSQAHRLVAAVDADSNGFRSGAPSGIRRSATSRGASWTAGTPRPGRAARPITAIRAAGRTACHPQGRSAAKDARKRVDTPAGPQLRGPDLPDRDRWRRVGSQVVRIGARLR